MNVTQASTVKAPAMTQSLPKLTRTFAMPANHLLPNMTPWTFPTRPVQSLTQVPTVLPPISPTPATSIPIAQSSTMTIPVTNGGAVYYVQPTTTSTSTSGIPFATTQPAATLRQTAATIILTAMSNLPQSSTNGLSVQDLASLLASTIEDHLPEWKLAQYSGDPMQWHEWLGQFKSAVDFPPLTDDVKLTYLKTLVTGKAKTAWAEFADCGAMYKDALNPWNESSATTSCCICVSGQTSRFPSSEDAQQRKHY